MQVWQVSALPGADGGLGDISVVIVGFLSCEPTTGVGLLKGIGSLELSALEDEPLSLLSTISVFAKTSS